MNPSTTYDYIVIGGGSAGCVAAAQLAREGDATVLLLEAGDPAERNPETLRADGYRDAFVNNRLMWERFSARQPGCADKRIFVGTGRGMGGSGSINAMVYLRGGEADFECWPEGWRWGDLLADYESLEAELSLDRRPPTDFSETCIAAAEQAGFVRSEDLNDGA